MLRYDDIDREFTKKELERRDFVDNSIMELINKLNPTSTEIKYNAHIVSKICNALVDIYTNDLHICTERAFYP
jgi:DNA polymerase sigma